MGIGGLGLTIAGPPDQPVSRAGGSCLPRDVLAGSQLQLSHVSHHRRGVESLLLTPQCPSAGMGCLRACCTP